VVHGAVGGPLVALVLLVACAPAAPTGLAPGPTGSGTGVVRIAWDDVGLPNPFRVSAAGPGGAVLLSLIYDTLTWKDDNGIMPWLAATWDTSPDGRDLTFTLAHNVRWQDGQPLTADDVAFSFDTYAQHPFRWMPTDMVENTTALAPDTVRVHLRAPYPPFVEEVAGSVPIIPRHIWEHVDDPLKYAGPDATIGSGPYRLAEYRSADGAYRLVANPDYFKGRPSVAEIQQINAPTATRVQSVLQGQIDLALSVDASVLDLLPADGRIKVLETAPLSLVRLVLNTEQPPLDRVEVRQALMDALDRSAVARSVTHGAPVLGSAGIVPPETPWFAPKIQQYAYDPAAARQLLGGQPLTLDLLANPEYREPELLQPMLAAVGITLRTQRIDAKSKADRLRNKQFQMAELQHIGIGGDPDYLRRWYTGQEANESLQGDILHDPAFDALAQQQATTLDPSARRALIGQMQAILANDLPSIPLFYRRFYWVYDSTKIAPMNTWSGLMNGIPFVQNKLVFLTH
jgi:peptide/nickel transport system substrate-binding protein